MEQEVKRRVAMQLFPHLTCPTISSPSWGSGWGARGARGSSLATGVFPEGSRVLIMQRDAKEAGAAAAGARMLGAAAGMPATHSCSCSCRPRSSSRKGAGSSAPLAGACVLTAAALLSKRAERAARGAGESGRQGGLRAPVNGQAGQVAVTVGPAAGK